MISNQTKKGVKRLEHRVFNGGNEANEKKKTDAATGDSLSRRVPHGFLMKALWGNAQSSCEKKEKRSAKILEGAA